jgi:hypothetical protein
LKFEKRSGRKKGFNGSTILLLASSCQAQNAARSDGKKQLLIR